MSLEKETYNGSCSGIIDSWNNLYNQSKLFLFTSTLDNLLCKEDGHYFRLEIWKKYFYRKQGEGKPILLIHDLTVNSSSHEWNKLVKSLKKNETQFILSTY